LSQSTLTEKQTIEQKGGDGQQRKKQLSGDQKERGEKKEKNAIQKQKATGESGPKGTVNQAERLGSFREKKAHVQGEGELKDSKISPLLGTSYSMCKGGKGPQGGE